jgi:Plasmid pRiA4b ORF-3-like protein
MTGDDTAPVPDDADDDALLRAWAAQLRDATPAQLHEALQQVMAAAGDRATAAPHAPPASARRPRRPDTVIYRVRVGLTGTTPPLWRRLELASDLFLDDVHQVIQAAFGWTDTHLHRFSAGPPHTGRNSEQYLCAFDVDEGDAGVPEQEVRIDEVLVDVGDRLYYTYDYGDDWQHRITLEAVEPREGDGSRAVCIAGRRPDPPEDCGGVAGYELRVAAGDPDHPEHETATAELTEMYGGDVVDDLPAPGAFDVDEVNAALAANGLQGAAVELPRPLAELAGAVRATEGARHLRELIAAADLNAPLDIEPDAAARMVRPYTWLLHRVGEDGIKLTAAGYLPPADVAAAFTELGLADEWIGKGNREDLTLPVLHLRESAQRAGLLRKYKKRLRLTAHGRAGRDDPVTLWRRLAERTPPHRVGEFAMHAGLIVLLVVAAGGEHTDLVEGSLALVLDAVGWAGRDGAPLSSMHLADATRETTDVLHRVGAVDGRGLRGLTPTAGGRTFARAALRTWPDAG